MNPRKIPGALSGCLFLTFVLSLVTVFGQTAATNSWTKPTSGYWEEPFWSLGTLPSTNQAAVALTNPGWKALAIGANTTANHPGSLTINNLIIDAPINSANQLLLNWAGVDVPVVVRSNLVVGTNGSVACHYSTLVATNVLLQGSATFSDHSRTTLEQLTMNAGGLLNINDVYFISSRLRFLTSGTVTQAAGIAVISRIDTDSARGAFPFPTSPAYYLLNGVLVSGVADVGQPDLTDNIACTIVQSGGVHTNSTMNLSGDQRHFQQIIRLGRYVLSAGLLVSGQTTVSGGSMDQSGGTNRTRELVVNGGGFYTLNGGQLVTSNTTVDTVDCLRNIFLHNGGSHTVQNRFALTDGVVYSLLAGTLSAPLIEIYTGAVLQLSGGTLLNSGMVVLHRGGIRVGNSPQQFGKLQVLDSPIVTCGSDPNIPETATIFMGASNGPAVLRFADSRDVPWSAVLYIRNWSTNHSGNGPDRIFVGASSQALTPSQLNRVIFIRPSDLPSDYSGALTASGELVPGAVHDYDYVVTDGTVTITRYTGPGGNITVPSMIENLPVTVIGYRAFNFIASLTSVTLPDTIADIGEGAFDSCRGLTNINLGNGVIRIGDRAFSHCENLSSITIPASVREVGDQLFEFSDNLLAITVHPDNLFYSSIDGVLFDESQTRLIQFPLGRAGAYAVPETVRSIEDYAFRGCSYLSNVTLSASVTNIGEGAFEFCEALTNIVIQEGVRTLGAFAFWHCSSLASISLPDSLTSIGARAFEQSALTRAEIGRGIAVFGGAHYFAYCPNLAGLYFRGDAPAVISDFHDSTPNVIAYYLPGTVGWGPTFAGRPTAPWHLAQPLILDFGPGFGVQANAFGFRISWATNATVIVEASTNLHHSNWSPVSTNTLTSGSSYFSDPGWTNHARRFYRLRAP